MITSPHTDYHKLLNAITRQGDPGYVPMLELSIDPEIVSAVLEEPFISLDDQDELPELSVRATGSAFGSGARWVTMPFVKAPPFCFQGLWTSQLRTRHMPAVTSAAG